MPSPKALQGLTNRYHRRLLREWAHHTLPVKAARRAFLRLPYGQLLRESIHEWSEAIRLPDTARRKAEAQRILRLARDAYGKRTNEQVVRRWRAYALARRTILGAAAGSRLAAKRSALRFWLKWRTLRREALEQRERERLENDTKLLEAAARHDRERCLGTALNVWVRLDARRKHQLLMLVRAARHEAKVQTTTAWVVWAASNRRNAWKLRLWAKAFSHSNGVRMRTSLRHWKQRARRDHPHHHAARQVANGGG